MSDPQKISVLHLISSNDFLGAERVLCELASNTDPNRFQIQVGILGSSEVVYKCFEVSLNGSVAKLIYFPCTGKLSLNSITAVQHHIRSYKVNILHSHGYKSDIYGFLAAKLARSYTRLIATNHTWKLRTLSERVYKVIDKTILKRFEAIVAVSDEVKEEMIRLGVSSGRISIVNNGVSVSGYESQNRTVIRQMLNVASHELLIGCVASLTIEKAHSDLLRAFVIVRSKAQNIRLVLVGDGPERENLMSLSEQLGIGEFIIFAGQRQDVKSLYTAFDLFALVSYAEGLPMAMLEAMAASLPIVVSAVGAIPQVIKTMENGILITPRDIDGIANFLIKLAQDPALREALGRNARNEVVVNYSVDRMARNYEHLYDKVLEGDL